MIGLQNWLSQWFIKCENWFVKYILRFLPAGIYDKTRFLKQYLIDRIQRIDSAKDVGYDELGFDARTGSPYNPGSWWDLKATLGDSVSTEDVFIDFGSGKGRMVCMAAREYPFKRVIGVEICEGLTAIARRNIQKNLHRMRCKNIELITANVVNYEVPDEITVVYMFNPFFGDVFANVIRKLLDSLSRRPRQLRLIYRIPTMHEFLVQNGFQVETQLPDITVYVAGLKQSS
ncbi:MAG: class I SAM-dependent methyltransferase [Chloroflexi bacterium]|nr:class I SAM-dependent methyltransferase [Chloroflexota bacterium]